MGRLGEYAMVGIVITLLITIINSAIAYYRYRTRLINLQYSKITEGLFIHFIIQWTMLISSIVSNIQSGLGQHTLLINIVAVLAYLVAKVEIRKQLSKEGHSTPNDT